MWRTVTSNSWVLGVLESGYRLSWAGRKPPLVLLPPLFIKQSSAQAELALDQEVASLIAKRAIEQVQLPSLGFYGRIFVVPKATGGWRPVLDLSPLNRHLERVKFKMETPSSVRQAVQQKDWATSIDLKDAYFHILIHPNDRKWLRFVWKQKAFQFRALPFGLSPAPLIFTRVVREFASLARQKAIRLSCYLDDWLILAQSQARCAAHTRQMLDLAESLGFIPNPEKCDLTPSQSFDYLGMTFDTTSMLVRPTQSRLEKLHTLLLDLRASQTASARLLSSLLGTMESLAPIIPLGRLMKRPLQREFRQRWDQTSQPWDALIQLGPWFLSSTSQWLDSSLLASGVPIVDPTPEVELYTDASCVGWGGHANSLSAAGTWSVQERSWHINRLELEAVSRSLQTFLPHLSGKVVRLFTDNTTVAFYVNKQGGAHSIPLSQAAEALLMWCHRHRISLSARHIPGKLNILADSLSRSHCVLQTEWTINLDCLRPVWEQWFRPMVDLFVTRFNHRLQLYISPVPDPEALAVDALSVNWTNLLGYAFPPLPILNKVIRKAREEGVKMILIAPLWPAQPWFPDLLSLTHFPPLRLSPRPDLLIQPWSGVRHNNPGLLKLHAWMLCGKSCDHQAPLPQ